MPKRTCSIAGCDSPQVARTWCNKHYLRWRHHGDSNGKPTLSAAEHLLARSHVGEHGCRIWSGPFIPGRGRGGDYGRLKFAGQMHYVHRLAYEVWVGPIPEGHEVDHVAARGCRSTLCIEPGHLEAVPREENFWRSECISVVNAVKTHCKRGHPFDVANTYYLPSGGRECRACRKNRQTGKAADPAWRAYRAACKRRLRAQHKS